jgi:peptide/nickel transport system permease protein
MARSFEQEAHGEPSGRVPRLRPGVRAYLAAHPALRHTLRAIAKLIFMVWVVATITFLVVRALPGNPVEIFIQDLVRGGMPYEDARQRASITLRIDVDTPLPAQYVAYLGNLIRLDLGDSYVIARGKSVTDVIGARLPWTLFSVGISLSISFWLGVKLGLLAAYRRNSRLDHVVTNLSAAMDAVPAVLLAVLAILLLGVVWKVVPIDLMRGAYGANVKPGLTIPFLVSALTHLLIPGLVYVLSSLGAWILAMRSNTIGILGDDYVTMARARGLPEKRVREAYVGRNARLPLVTAFAIALGFTVGGSVLIEQIFVYPGVGFTLAQAVARRDYPVMQGILIVTTVCVLLAVTVADALYGWLDPRIRQPAERT